MFIQRWAKVEDGGPTLNQHLFTSRVCWDMQRQ